MSNSRPRVFITQENSHLNYNNAEEFGEIVFLTRDEVSPVPGSLTNSAIMEEMGKKLLDFDFDNDFLAPSGSPVVSGLAFLILGIQEEGRPDPQRLRVLRWSNRDRVYQPITIDLK